MATGFIEPTDGPSDGPSGLWPAFMPVQVRMRVQAGLKGQVVAFDLGLAEAGGATTNLTRGDHELTAIQAALVAGNYKIYAMAGSALTTPTSPAICADSLFNGFTGLGHHYEAA